MRLIRAIVTIATVILVSVLGKGQGQQVLPPSNGGTGAGISACSTTPPTTGAAHSTCYDTNGVLQQCNNAANACTTSGQWVAQGAASTLTNPSMGAGPSSISRTATAGTGGVTANYLVAKDTSNPTRRVLPASGGCGGGFAATTATVGNTFEMYVAAGLVVTGVADNAITAGHILIGGTSTPGRVMDSGQTSRTAIPSSTCIVGVALQTQASPGSNVLLEYDGPGSYGDQRTGVAGLGICAGGCYQGEVGNAPWVAPYALTLTSCTARFQYWPIGTGNVTVDILAGSTVGGQPGNSTLSGGTSIFGSNPVITFAGGGTSNATATPSGAGATLAAGDYLHAQVTNQTATVISQTTSGSTSQGASTIVLNASTNVAQGQLVSGPANIQANTYVTGVNYGTNTASISLPTVSGSIANGTTINFTATGSIITTATASSAATSLTVASAANIAVGQAVTGAGIAPGTVVTGAPSGNSVPIFPATTAPLSSTIVTFTETGHGLTIACTYTY